MADFKTHITVSTVLGAGCGVAGAMWLDVPVPTAIIAAGLCGVGGMLPDIDSDSGVPLRESLAFAAAVMPMMLAGRLHGMNISHEWIVLAGAAMYLSVRFLVAAILRNLTVHRGMFHSIPAMLIFGELVYLLSAGGSDRQRLIKAIAVMIGFGSHLLLDEIYSFSLRGGRLHLKSSFGTAIKLFGPSMGPNAVTFGLLLALSYAAFADPNVRNELRAGAAAVARLPQNSPAAATWREKAADAIRAVTPQPKPSTENASPTTLQGVAAGLIRSLSPSQNEPTPADRENANAAKPMQTIAPVQDPAWSATTRDPYAPRR